MNFYLLQLVSKAISFVTLSTLSLFGFEMNTQKIEISNQNYDKSINVTTDIIDYKVIEAYDKSIPNNITKVVNKGQKGLTFIDNNGEIILKQEAVNENVIVGTGANGLHNGILTGYGPDCKTCSGVGNVACKTVDKKVFNLINDGIYYNDTEFGSVRVLAAALTKFPCGTIVEVKDAKIGDFTGVVLDTGYDMRKALENSVYHFDVAYKTEKDDNIRKTTDKTGNVKFNVQRWGW